MPWTKVLLGDCRKLLSEIEPVDLVITSFPYKTKDGFSIELIREVGQLLRRAVKPNGRIWANFAQLSEDYLRPAKVQIALAESLTALQTPIWIKSAVIEGWTRGHYTPLVSKSKLYYGYEHLFQFCNGSSPRDLNKLAIGTPYSDVGNLSRGGRGKNGNLHDPGDVFNIELEEPAMFIPYKTTGKTEKKDHEYQFPLELVRRLIKLSNLPEGATILDPFYGGGSVGKVANEMGFNAVGIEIDESKVKYRGEDG